MGANHEWPPDRNQIAGVGAGPVTHGAYTRARSAMDIRGRKVARLVRRMRTVMPWLEDSDLPACRSWAELEIVGAALFAGIVKEGATHTDDKGDVAARRLVEDHRKNRIAKLAYERELGMTPVARMALKTSSTHMALDLAAVMAQEPDEGEEVVPMDNLEPDALPKAK